MVITLVSIWIVWSQMANFPTLMGEAEAVKAQVASPKIGVVKEVLVERFAEVKAGDPLVIIKPDDTADQLDRIRLQLQTLAARTDSNSKITLRRAEADYYALKIDLLNRSRLLRPED